MEIDKSKDYVVRVRTPEASEFVQKILISLGYGWYFGTRSAVEQTDKAYLFFSPKDKSIMQSNDHDWVADYVKRGRYVQVTVDNVIEFGAPLEPLNVGILEEYPIVISQDGVRAGCQFIPREKFEELISQAQGYFAKVDSLKK